MEVVNGIPRRTRNLQYIEQIKNKIIDAASYKNIIESNI